MSLPRPVSIAAVLGVMAVGTVATMAGFNSAGSSRSDRNKAELRTPRSLCAYVAHLVDEGPVPADNFSPTAVLMDPRLGDRPDPSSTTDTAGPSTTDADTTTLGPVSSPGPDGAAAIYMLAEDGVISSDPDQAVAIPSQIADDYKVFTDELHRLVFEEPGKNLAPSAQSVAAAVRVEQYLSTCKPS